MAGRSRGRRTSTKSEILGSHKLTLARIIITLESALQVFAVPLAVAAVFLICAWFRLFIGLYPWGHLAALVIFFATFFHAVGVARLEWRPITRAAARRRIERLGLLSHRPLDVLDDTPVTQDEGAQILWHAHVARAEFSLMDMRWPKWMSSLSSRDPYGLRYGIVLTLIVSIVVGWGALGGRLVEAVNPALGRMHLFTPTLDAWITPPEYTHTSPIMIATPAGIRHTSDTIEVPDGSIISAHLVGQDGGAPELLVNNDSTEFTADEHGDFQVTTALHEGDTVTIRRGWENVASWRVKIKADAAPTVAFDGEPSVTEHKSVRLAYTASDDFGVASVTAHITPRESLAGASSEPVDVTLSSSNQKEIKQAAFEDLTAHPWAGLPVDITLVATDAAGHRSESAAQNFVLPEREFFHPVARALVGVRRKLLQTPLDDGVRNEVANLMAGVAQHPASYHGDPVVMMALRAGAVRMVLNRGVEEVPSVVDLLWQSAVRIEDGTVGVAEQNLRAAQKELADALDRGASDAEINRLIDRLHQALSQYLSQLATKVAAHPGGMVQDLSVLEGQKSNMLTPEDLNNMLEQMRDLSASGKREDARQELAKLQQMLESLRTTPAEMTAEQKQDLQTLKALHEIEQTQKDLMDKTFQQNHAGASDAHKDLAKEQSELLKKLQGLLGHMKDGGGDNTKQAASAMDSATGKLGDNKLEQALVHQGAALKALQQAGEQMASNLRQSMLMLGSAGRPGEGGNDPFGRSAGMATRDDGTVKVPEKFQAHRVREILDELQHRAGDMTRPKPERDYIERLLQNF